MGLKPFFFFWVKVPLICFLMAFSISPGSFPSLKTLWLPFLLTADCGGRGESCFQGAHRGSHRPTQQLHCDLRVSCLATVITSSNCFLSCNIIITDLITYCIQFPGLGNLGQNLEFYLPLAPFQFNSDLLPLKPYRNFNLLFH